MLSQHFFTTLKCFYLVTGKCDGSKPIHIWKIRNGDFLLEKTASKNMQTSANDVMSKMADFRLFWPKNRNISSMTHPIITNDTIIFIPKSLPNQWHHSFGHCRWWKNGCCKGTPFEALPPNNICSKCPMPRLHTARLIKIHSPNTNYQYLIKTDSKAYEVIILWLALGRIIWYFIVLHWNSNLLQAIPDLFS